jgi:hypothetical protein
MTEKLKKVLDWFYLGPNPYANQYFRQIVAGEPKDKEEGIDETKRREGKTAAAKSKKPVSAAR